MNKLTRILKEKLIFVNKIHFCFFFVSFDVSTKKRKSCLVKYTNKQKKTTTNRNKQKRLREQIMSFINWCLMNYKQRFFVFHSLSNLYHHLRHVDLTNHHHHHHLAHRVYRAQGNHVQNDPVLNSDNNYLHHHRRHHLKNVW